MMIGTNTRKWKRRKWTKNKIGFYSKLNFISTGTNLLEKGKNTEDPNESSWGITCDEFVQEMTSNPVLKKCFTKEIDLSAEIANFRKRRFERLSPYIDAP